MDNVQMYSVVDDSLLTPCHLRSMRAHLLQDFECAHKKIRFKMKDYTFIQFDTQLMNNFFKGYNCFY